MFSQKQTWDPAKTRNKTVDINLKGVVFLNIREKTYEFLIVYVTQEVLCNFTALLNTHPLRAHLYTRVTEPHQYTL
jgi:hypothetical protein